MFLPVVVVILLSTLMQILLYWLFTARKWNYVDFVLLALAVTCNSWLFPRVFLLEAKMAECAYSVSGLVLTMFLIGGNLFSVVTFFVYTRLRR